jgi:hypothetical protein
MLPGAAIFEAATDVDNVASLSIARREKTWRGYLAEQPPSFSPHVTFIQTATTLPLWSRPPPR